MKYWAILVLLFFGCMINWVDKSIVGLAIDPIMADFGMTYTQWGLVGSFFFWCFAFGALFGGPITDRFGTKNVLIVLMIAWAILQFSVYFIPTISLFLLYRILLGAFEGPFMPAAFKFIGEKFPANMHGKANSIFLAGGTIGAVFVVPVIVFSINALGWRETVAITGLLSIVWLAFWILLSKRTLKESKNKVNEEVKLEKLSWKELFHVLRQPSYICILLALFANFWLISWIALWLPGYLLDVTQISPINMGISIMFVGVFNIIINFGAVAFSDYLFKRNGSYRKSRVFLTSASLILSALLLVSVTVFQSIYWVVPAIGLAYGLANVTLALFLPLLIRFMPGRGGLMTGIGIFSYNMAGVVSPLINGVLLDNVGENIVLGFNLTIIVMAIVLSLAAIIAAVVVKPDQQGARDLPDVELSNTI